MDSGAHIPKIPESAPFLSLHIKVSLNLTTHSFLKTLSSLQHYPASFTALTTTSWSFLVLHTHTMLVLGFPSLILSSFYANTVVQSYPWPENSKWKIQNLSNKFKIEHHSE